MGGTFGGMEGRLQPEENPTGELALMEVPKFSSRQAGFADPAELQSCDASTGDSRKNVCGPWRTGRHSMIRMAVSPDGR